MDYNKNSIKSLIDCLKGAIEWQTEKSCKR
jgi:hypothetical protein